MIGFQKNNFQDIRASNAHLGRDPAIYKIMLADNMPELMCDTIMLNARCNVILMTIEFKCRYVK